MEYLFQKKIYSYKLNKFITLAVEDLGIYHGCNETKESEEILEFTEELYDKYINND